MIKRRKFPKVFFGWWIVLVGGILAFWGYGWYSFGFSALFKPISSELRFSRAVTSVAASIGRLEAGLQGPLIGWISDKFGPRWMILAGVFIIGLSLVLMSLVDSLWAFYIVWGVLFGTGHNMSVTISIDTLIANWFVKKRGLAISTKMTIAGLSALLLVPLIAWMITIQGWRMTSLFGGLVMWVVGLPLTWFFVKQHRPEYYGLLPDGAAMEGEAAEANQMIDRGVEYAEEVEEVEFTLRQSLRTRTYWLIILSQLGAGTVVAVFTIHSIPFLTDMGIDSVKAAMMVGVISLTHILTRFIIGLVADRFKKQHLRFLLGGAYFLQAIGITVFLLNPTIATAYVLYICYYSAFGVTLPLISIMRARYFGRKGFGSIQGTSLMLLAPLETVAPVYAGWVYDTTGNYITAFTLLVGLLVFSTAVIFFASPPQLPAGVTDVRKIM